MLDDYDILQFSALLLFIGFLLVTMGHPVIGGLIILSTVFNLRRDDEWKY